MKWLSWMWRSIKPCHIVPVHRLTDRPPFTALCSPKSLHWRPCEECEHESDQFRPVRHNLVRTYTERILCFVQIIYDAQWKGNPFHLVLMWHKGWILMMSMKSTVILVVTLRHSPALWSISGRTEDHIPPTCSYFLCPARLQGGGGHCCLTAAGVCTRRVTEMSDFSFPFSTCALIS